MQDLKTRIYFLCGLNSRIFKSLGVKISFNYTPELLESFILTFDDIFQKQTLKTIAINFEDEKLCLLIIA